MSAALSNQVLGLPVSFDAYIRHGWSLVAIPRGTKGPWHHGWNKPEAALKDSTLIPPDYGVGLCHAYSGTCAIDIDSWDDAISVLSEHGIDLNALYNAPDAVTINSGMPGHGKLIYQMPFGLALPSKKITHSVTGKVVYELRCSTSNGLTVQDVLPPSIHPTTNQPYQWGGKGKWTDLPQLPFELFNLWQELVNRDSQRNIDNGSLNASWDDIREAISFIKPDCSRDEWLAVGMSLHYAGNTTNDIGGAFAIWDDWSSQSKDKYKGQQDLEIAWRSFRSDRPDGVKLGTLFHLASQNGWKPPAPDVSELFKNTDIPSPADLLNSLKFPAPDIDVNLFPPILRRRAQEVSVSVGCDVLSPLWAGMVAVSTAMDARSRLE